MRRLLTTVFSLGLIALSSCGPFEQDCTSLGVPGITVAVVDAATNLGIAAGATAIAVDGTYADSVTVGSNAENNTSVIALASERAGTYTVTVRKTAYVDWVKGNVRVRDAGCHVLTIPLTARMVAG